MPQQFWTNVQDIFGNALPSAMATITGYPAGNIASIFSDQAMTVPLANPLTLSNVTGGTAILAFFAANGTYQVSVLAQGVTEPYLRVVTLNDGTLTRAAGALGTGLTAPTTITQGGIELLYNPTVVGNITQPLPILTTVKNYDRQLIDLWNVGTANSLIVTTTDGAVGPSPFPLTLPPGGNCLVEINIALGKYMVRS